MQALQGRPPSNPSFGHKAWKFGQYLLIYIGEIACSLVFEDKLDLRSLCVSQLNPFSFGRKPKAIPVEMERKTSKLHTMPIFVKFRTRIFIDSVQIFCFTFFIRKENGIKKSLTFIFYPSMKNLIKIFQFENIDLQRLKKHPY